MSIVHRRLAAAVILLECLAICALAWLVTQFARGMCQFNQADGRNLDDDCGLAGPGGVFYAVAFVAVTGLAWCAVVLASTRVTKRLPGQVTAASLAAVTVLQAGAALCLAGFLVDDASGGFVLLPLAEFAALLAVGYVFGVAGRQLMTGRANRAITPQP